ncbi:hypothetical protein SAMN05216225_102642 [Ornithinibacillus halophilus]|uniref:Uncharacterized protein n=1 Tax=Ornithinibacillus halophilus TaxID=930117 RepID=A0A1M5IWK4_9BACI|nr:hypothetical protein SAMN05216225_102642 [Ornithinibacillus halophilus]
MRAPLHHEKGAFWRNRGTMDRLDYKVERHSSILQEKALEHEDPSTTYQYRTLGQATYTYLGQEPVPAPHLGQATFPAPH